MGVPAAGPVEQGAGVFQDWIDYRPVAERVTEATGLISDVVGIALQYITGEKRIGAFGPNFWLQRGVDPCPMRPINYDFYDFWHGPDPVDPTRRVSETHHHPVWIPENLSLGTVEKAGLQFQDDDTLALEQHRDTPTSGEYYAVMRKEVLGRDLSEVEQIELLTRAGYPGLAQAVDVAAVIFAANQHDGSRWLGDETGAETCETCTLCVETVEHSFFDFSYEVVLAVGNFASSGVEIDELAEFDMEQRVGVAALRKF